MRSVEQGEGLAWLHAHEGEGVVVTSPPDASELALALPAYFEWLHNALVTCMASSAGPTVFILTDRRYQGRWLDKGWAAAGAAFQLQRDLLWHRIALRRAPGATDPRVPTYSHLLAYGPGRPGRPRPDVILEGRRPWAHGVSHELARYLAAWVAESGAQALMDPFAGYGTILAAAEEAGLDALGCELDPWRAKVAADYSV